MIICLIKGNAAHAEMTIEDNGREPLNKIKKIYVDTDTNKKTIEEGLLSENWKIDNYLKYISSPEFSKDIETIIKESIND